jgi:segregation and condensation protein A
VAARKVWSIKEARTRLEHLLGERVGNWVQLDLCLERYLYSDEGRTALASTFGATLELAREGLVDIRQDAPFATLYMRRRDEGAEWEAVI